MKKQYFTPEMEVVKIKTQQILAGSPDAIIDPTETVNPGEIE